jgi:hypothetical protein
LIDSLDYSKSNLELVSEVELNGQTEFRKELMQKSYWKRRAEQKNVTHSAVVHLLVFVKNH